MLKRRILIVDDNADMRLGMHLRLKAPISTIPFSRSDAFFGVAEARKHLPDLILLDLGLPGGDGFTVMERLRKIPFLAVIPVIVVSARDGLGNQKRAFEAGAKASLEKPVNNDELLAVIRQSLNEIAGINQPALGSQGLA